MSNDMKLIMGSWRKKLLTEITDWGCNKHSLGWIDPDGIFYDISEDDPPDHDKWMQNYIALEFNREFDGRIPENWIKVSNASEMFFAATAWHDLTFKQFEGMCHMWLKCKKYSPWLSIEIESFKLTFGITSYTPTGDGRYYVDDDMESLTIPEFIEKYIGREGEDLFFQMLG